MIFDGGPWFPPDGGGGGGAPSGSAGGDLGGTYPNPTLSSAKQQEIDDAADLAGQADLNATAASNGAFAAQTDATQALADADAAQITANAAVPAASGIVTVNATNNLSTARPAGADVAYWVFNDDAVDPGASGENIVNAQDGDLWYVPDA